MVVCQSRKGKQVLATSTELHNRIAQYFHLTLTHIRETVSKPKHINGNLRSPQNFTQTSRALHANVISLAHIQLTSLSLWNWRALRKSHAIFQQIPIIWAATERCDRHIEYRSQLANESMLLRSYGKCDVRLLKCYVHFARCQSRNTRINDIKIAPVATSDGNYPNTMILFYRLRKMSWKTMKTFWLRLPNDYQLFHNEFLLSRQL